MPLQLNRDELIRSLRNLFGFRGSTNLEVSETLIATANLAELDDPPFHNKGGGITNLAAGPVVGQVSYVGLRAPVTLPPNFRAVIKVVTNPSAQAEILKIVNSATLDATLAGPTLAVTSGTWDSVLPDAPQLRPQLLSYITSNAAVFAGPDGFLLAPSGVPVVAKFVLAPGNTLVLQGANVNANVQGVFYWDEYSLG